MKVRPWYSIFVTFQKTIENHFLLLMQDKINSIIQDLEEKKEAQDNIREYSLIMRILEDILLLHENNNNNLT